MVLHIAARNILEILTRPSSWHHEWETGHRQMAVFVVPRKNFIQSIRQSVAQWHKCLLIFSWSIRDSELLEKLRCSIMININTRQSNISCGSSSHDVMCIYYIASNLVLETFDWVQRNDAISIVLTECFVWKLYHWCNIRLLVAVLHITTREILEILTRHAYSRLNGKPVPDRWPSGVLRWQYLQSCAIHSFHFTHICVQLSSNS